MSKSQKEQSRMMVLKLYINAAYVFSGMSLVLVIDYFKVTREYKMLILELIFIFFLALTVIWSIFKFRKTKNNSSEASNP